MGKFAENLNLGKRVPPPCTVVGEVGFLTRVETILE